MRTCSTFSGAARRIALAARSAEAGEEEAEEEAERDGTEEMTDGASLHRSERRDSV